MKAKLTKKLTKKVVTLRDLSAKKKGNGVKGGSISFAAKLEPISLTNATISSSRITLTNATVS
jgi:hypothetical protein